MNDIVTTHQQIARDTTTIHYWLAGPVGRPLLVFTHGGMMDHHMFDAQLAAVASEYRVLLWDVRGHGQSQPLGIDGVLSLRTIVDDLLAIVDQLGYQRACFIGQSFGANITQELAFLHPERVSALVIIGAYCITAKAPPALEQRRAQIGLNDVPAENLKQFLANTVAVRPEVKAYVLEACAPPETWSALRRSIPTFFHEEASYRISVPFLLTRGDQDALTDVAQQAPLWAQREPNCRYIVIPDAGHNANQDNPEFFNRELLAFLHDFVE
ncbi:alpha/beta hydrolase [Reticulibacter mediterranei]|uniref:Alpha/beta hydrolase n=1 Tax=Reticulibacter mediterranei TaxID=2778369 RepID=A0A8J3N751_9CHLR|nr:alpha/beta hydrolase [Reticulibacter mediterranei]GHO98110.1 alpha/beta hydrolase [Reticulibacter mediterranei]